MDVLGFFLAAIIGVVAGIILGWYGRWKFQKKKMDQMEDDVNNWKRIQTANQHGIPLRAVITQVTSKAGTEPETTMIEIIAARKMSGRNKLYHFRDTFIVNNNSHAWFQIPDQGDEVTVIVDVNDHSIYYMERPW
jgi:hypothetical protein